MKRLLLLATGGTIASATSAEGLIPTFDAEALLHQIPEIKEWCDIQGLTLMNIDSTNMTPSRMKRIAASIYERLADYDGFVITHGTDTMAYTSAALVYMLQNIRKPVVLTGSQEALKAPYTDAKENISNAVRFALQDVSGIYICFDGMVIDGARAAKVKSRSTDAFYSVNFPVVARIKLGRVTFNNALRYNGLEKALQADPAQPTRLATDLCEEVMVVKLIPGMKEQYFDYLKDRYKGVIIESFGLGGIPGAQPDIVSKVKELLEARIAVAITTQCLEEGTELNVYAVGTKLARYPVIQTGDMNSEAIVMKLMWALGNLSRLEEVKRFVETPIFGDRTPSALEP